MSAKNIAVSVAIGAVTYFAGQWLYAQWLAKKATA